MKPETDQKNRPAPIIGELGAPSSLQPLGGVQPENRPESNQPAKSSPYEDDAWEKMSFSRKVAAIGFFIFVWGIFLVLIGAIDKPEVIASSILGITIAFITLNQYYVAKKQWWVMGEGLKRTDALIEQSERHFRMAERPIVYVDEVFGEVQEDKQLAPHLQISNRGRGPAVDITWWVAVSLENHTFEPEFSYGGQIDVLAPGAEPFNLYVAPEANDWVITKKLYNEITNPQYNRYIYIFYGGAYWDSDKQTCFVLEECAWKWTSEKGWLKDAFVIPFTRTLRNATLAEGQAKKENPN